MAVRQYLWCHFVGVVLIVLVLVPNAPAQVRSIPLAPDNPRELVAVLDFDAVGTTKSESAALSDRLREELLGTGKYLLVDRSQINQVLEEQALQQSGCTSQECAVKVGKVLGARKLVTGRAIRVSSDLWQISAQMVDVETSETVAAASIRHQGDILSLLDTAIVELASRLSGTPAPAARQAPSTATTKGAPNTETTWREPLTGMEFVFVPGGEFQQGCGGSWAGECFDEEKPARHVRLGPFWLGKTEVTQGQWKRIMGDNPSRSNGGDYFPVESVTWDEVQEFLRRLNAQSSGVNFRLPTEAEWEYACRSGGKELAYGTDSGSISRFSANYGGNNNGTQQVGKYPPNALGIYDMAGNVWEWVQDAYAQYNSSAAENPLSTTGTYRVNRGGGWNDDARRTRCSLRDSDAPSYRDRDVGFRVARNP